MSNKHSQGDESIESILGTVGNEGYKPKQRGYRPSPTNTSKPTFKGGYQPIKAGENPATRPTPPKSE